jgi:hypothetical protein
MAVRLSALRAGRLLPPGRFLLLISVRGLGTFRSIGNETRDLPYYIVAMGNNDSRYEIRKSGDWLCSSVGYRPKLVTNV